MNFLLYILCHKLRSSVVELISRINEFDPDWVPVRAVVVGVAKGRAFTRILSFRDSNIPLSFHTLLHL
jgi:hypothetical protein